MKEDILLTPGPTPLPPQVREAMGRPIIHHRTKQYRAIFKRALEGMRQLMQTTNPVFCLTSSGTGAMEASVANLLSVADEAIVVLGGKFAERWQQLCKAYGVNVSAIPVAYGDAVDAKQLESALAAHPNAKAVFATLCETSTGVVHDIRSIAAITRKSPAVLVVDAISGFLADECRTDEWGIDVVVTGSQKGLMLPPGLAFLSLSQRAMALAKQSTNPRYYFDLCGYEKSLADDDTPFTSAVSTVIALDEALKLVLSRGFSQTIDRCALMANATRQAVSALGLELFAKRPSNGVTAVKTPSGVDGKKITSLMYEKSQVMVAGGQGEMAGKIFRFAHMGYISPEDVLLGLSALEDALETLGYKFDKGSGVGAARAIFGQATAAAAH